MKNNNNMLGKLFLLVLIYFLFVGSAVCFVYVLAGTNFVLGNKAVSVLVLAGFVGLSIMSMLEFQKNYSSFLKQSGMRSLKVLYHVPDLEKLQYVDNKSDWVDLRCAEEINISKGESALVNLGISVELPEGYEMIIAPRSSTFKNFGLIQTNSVGIIDETYCSDTDIIKWPCYATRDTFIKKGDRICQFRIIEHQPKLEFVEVSHLDGKERGGFGSTGIQ